VDPALIATTNGKLIVPLLEELELLEDELLEELELDDELLELLVLPELEEELLEDELDDELLELLLEDAVSVGPLHAQANSENTIGALQRVSSCKLNAMLIPPSSE
jgi:hypothetical protein